MSVTLEQVWSASDADNIRILSVPDRMKLLQLYKKKGMISPKSLELMEHPDFENIMAQSLPLKERLRQLAQPQLRIEDIYRASKEDLLRTLNAFGLMTLSLTSKSKIELAIKLIKHYYKTMRYLFPNNEREFIKSKNFDKLMKYGYTAEVQAYLAVSEKIPNDLADIFNAFNHEPFPFLVSTPPATFKGTGSLYLEDYTGRDRILSVLTLQSLMGITEILVKGPYVMVTQTGLDIYDLRENKLILENYPLYLRNAVIIADYLYIFGSSNTLVVNLTTNSFTGGVLGPSIDDSNKIYFDGNLAYQVSEDLIRVYLLEDGKITPIHHIATVAFADTVIPTEKGMNYTKILEISNGRIYYKNARGMVDIFTIKGRDFKFLRTFGVKRYELLVHQGRVYTLGYSGIKVYDEETLEPLGLLCSDAIGMKLAGNFLIVRLKETQPEFTIASDLKELKIFGVEVISIDDYNLRHRYYSRGRVYSAGIKL
jgi:hypothetical protein